MTTRTQTQNKTLNELGKAIRFLNEHFDILKSSYEDNDPCVEFDLKNVKEQAFQIQHHVTILEYCQDDERFQNISVPIAAELARLDALIAEDET